MNRIFGRRYARAVQRRGALYIAVIGTSLIVAMLSLAAIHQVRINLNRTQGAPTRLSASLLADAAVEHALATLANEPNWRSNRSSGISYPSTAVSMNGGSFTWKLIDSDGNLADNTADSVVVQGTAVLGDVTQLTEVTLQPTDTGISALEAAIHVANNISLGFTVDITTNTFVSSHGNISAGGIGVAINGSAEATGAISGNISGSETSGVAQRQMPDSTVFDYYKHMGTYIDPTPMMYNGVYYLNDVVLSPNSNPWGPTNPAGIYVIDCGGLEMRVGNCRILGTLVLLNLHYDSKIENRVLIEPAVSNFPSLLVDGSIRFQFDSGSKLSENTTSFNPPGTPYNGQSDNDTNDQFPSIVRGLVYVAGNANFVADSKDSYFEGSVVCGSIAANSDSKFTWYSMFLNYPPPGFGAGSQMEILPGSWRRVASP